MYDIFFPLLVTRHALCFFSTSRYCLFFIILWVVFLTQKQEPFSLYQRSKPLSIGQMVFFESIVPMLPVKQLVFKHVKFFQMYDLSSCDVSLKGNSILSGLSLMQHNGFYPPTSALPPCFFMLFVLETSMQTNQH